MQKITLTKTQRTLLERAASDRIAATDAENDVLNMIFAVHGVKQPTTQLSYAEGVISWTETPEPIEG